MSKREGEIIKTGEFVAMCYFFFKRAGSYILLGLWNGETLPDTSNKEMVGAVGGGVGGVHVGLRIAKANRDIDRLCILWTD